jgi:hypothetical protein
MRKLLLPAGLVAGLVAINARIDATRQCYCEPECWCQKRGLRHFRWVLPIGHRMSRGS